MTEQQPYEVLREYPGFELRRYPEHVVAETRARGSFENAGNASFMRLARYIGGRNTGSHKVAMTAPVVQEATDEQDAYVVGFVMPADLPHVPDPTDPDVRLRTIPAQVAAVATFSGRWTRGRFEDHERRLLADVVASGLEVDGRPRFARFDPPWTPWFLRRNEVVVPVRDPAQ